MSLESYLQKHPELAEEDLTEEIEETSVAEDSIPSVSEQPKPKRGPWWLVILLLILILFGVTCPTESDHREAVSAAVKERLSDKLDDDDDASLFSLSQLMNWVSGSMADAYILNELRIHKYLFISIGKVKTEDGIERTISLGLLNHVFTFLNKEREKE